MSSLRNLIVSTALVAGTLVVAPIEAAITLVPLSPTAFSTNEAAMNAALGITSYQIEGFEDTELLGSLSYRLGSPDAGTFTAYASRIFRFDRPGLHQQCVGWQPRAPRQRG